MRQGITRRVVIVLAVIGVVGAACSDSENESSVTEDPAPPAAEEPAAEEEAPEPAGDERSEDAGGGAATLTSMGGSGVSGEATLTLDPDSGVLTVVLVLEGVEEGARYRPFIAPDCEQGAGHIHLLDDVVGDSDGTVRATAEIEGVEAIDVDGGWSVKVALPPQGPQACGPVVAT